MGIQITGVHKTYRMGSIEVAALAGVSLDIHDGELVAIMGPSGSGKSTLMNILGCLDVPTSGSYQLDGQEVGRLKDDQLADVRRQLDGETGPLEVGDHVTDQPMPWTIVMALIPSLE